MIMKKGTLQYGDNSADYQIVNSENISDKIIIHVHPDGIIKVEAPEASSRDKISQAVQKRARWIMRQLKTASNARAHTLPRDYINGETHFYLGRRYQLKIHPTRLEPSSVKLRGQYIHVTLRVSDPLAVRRRLQNWYKDRAISYLTRRLAIVADKIIWLNEVPPLKFIRMQKQWGSCSPNGTINLNPDLIKAPRDCIDYVITHELCHLKEHNHSPDFYALLEYNLSDWKITKSKLDKMAELILSY